VHRPHPSVRTLGCAHCLSFMSSLACALLLQCPRTCSWRAAFADPLLVWRPSRRPAAAAAAFAAGAGAADEQHCWELPSVLTTCPEAAVPQGPAYMQRLSVCFWAMRTVRQRKFGWLDGDSMRGDKAAGAQGRCCREFGGYDDNTCCLHGMEDARISCCCCAIVWTVCGWLAPCGCV
jgi:hypothetical protein